MHEWLPRLTKPSGEEKRVQARPIARARRFISATKRSTVPPPAFCASAIAASLPDGSSSP